MNPTPFIERLAPALRAAVQKLDVGALLEDALNRARARWPTVQLTREGFFAHLAGKVSGDVPRALETLHVEDLYLAAGCAAGDEASLRAFEARFFTAGVPDEVRSVLRERLLVRRPDGEARISAYSGVAPLESWFRVAAARASLNLSRAEAPRVGDAVLAATALPGEGVELQHMKKLYRAEFAAAFAQALGALEVRDRNVLRLRYVDGLTLEQVAALHQVHPVTVARWQARAIEAVLRALRAALMTQLKVGASELDSILRLVRSDLDVTLRGLLGSGPSG
ncbi:MAG: sigma-70 family RNA polymerase sigma factor [Archangiaceae bacterium]|nr:sigma-70 family RNA polymerase sigma factor [Archangiaceae bacterium]